jgi:chromosome segregation ATPase
MSKTNMLDLVIENIGGIRKPLKLKLKQPVSIIKAPNATGKSSIVHALQLLCKNPLKLEHVLNQYEKRGRVELKNGEDFGVELLRVPEIGVEIVPEHTKLLWMADEKPFHLSFFTRDAELSRIIEEYEPERLKNWFRDISDARYYETAISVVNTLLGEKRSEHERLEAILKVEVDVKDKEKALADSQRQLAQVEKELLAVNKRLEESGFGELVRDRERIEGEIHVLRSQTWEMQGKRDDGLGEERFLRNKYDRLEKQRDNELEELYSLNEELKVEAKAEGTISKRMNDVGNGLRKVELALKNLENSTEGYQQSLDEMKRLPKKKVDPCIPILESLIDESQKKLEAEKVDRRSLQKERDDLSLELERLKRLRGNVEEKEREIADLEKDMSDLQEKQLPQIEDEVKRIELQATKLQADAEEKQKQLKTLIEKISKLKGVSGDFKKKIDELSERKRRSEEDIMTKREELRKILRARDEYNRAVVAVEKLEGFLAHMQNRYEFIIEETRQELNQALRKSFELMGFAGFEEIAITPEFELKVQRRGRKITDLQTLSSTERLTIALTIMFVAKQAYASDFPFFVIDEVKEPYDTTRFRRLANYMKGKVSYLLVTSVVPLTEKKELNAITVTYSLPK